MILIIKVIPFIISILLSTLVLLFNPTIQNSIIVNDEFLMNFIGLFLGIAIAVITFLFSVVEKLEQKIETSHIDNDKNIKIKNDIKTLFKEMKDDIMLIFIIFISSFILIIIKDLNIPLIIIPARLGISKINIIVWLKLVQNFLMLFAIYDIIASLFKIISTAQEL